MATTPFTIDTLNLAKELQEGGFTKQQSEAQVRVHGKIITFLFDKLATKQDLQLLGKELKAEIKDVRRDLSHDIDIMGQKMTIRLGSIVVLGIGLLAALIKFF